MRYPIYTPNVKPYLKSLHEAIESGWVSSQGEFINKARLRLQYMIGTPYVVMTNNGTSSTHLLYLSLKFKYPCLKTIYVPNYVFVAVWNCALYEYPADMLRVMDVNPDTLNMCEDEAYLRSLEPNAAVVVVHNVGNVVNVPRMKRIRPDLIIVEDVCEAFMEQYEGSVVGTASLCAGLSFFANKMVTSGEGGAFYTADKELYEFIYRTCHHGMTSERYIYDTLGYNYRMTNLQAALLYDQLLDIDAIISQKRTVYSRYTKLFPTETTTTGIWMFAVRLPTVRDSNHMCRVLSTYGVDIRPMFYDIHDHAHLQEIKALSDDFHHEQVVMIPSSSTLTAFDQVYIATRIHQYATNTLSPLEIVEGTADLIEAFARNEMPSTFRYFKNRVIPDCIKSHVISLIGLIENEPVAYAHIDFEEKNWIGICVLPAFHRRGYGRIIMQFLIDYARVVDINTLFLTVDIDNTGAQNLYTTLGFTVCDKTSDHFSMIKAI
jgi:perosamine synthetase